MTAMTGYTKLFNSILVSTIWRSPNATRIVWITLLAMSNKDGVCEGSLPGLADLARVTIQECESALAELQAPDPYSRTPDHEGRRIEVLPGIGWRLLNHGKYRERMSEEQRREYNKIKQAESRQRRKMSLTVIDNFDKSAMSAHTDTDTDTDKRKSMARKRACFDPLSIRLPDWLSPTLWAQWVNSRRQLGKRLTESASLQQIADLTLWKERGHSPDDIIRTSIRNGWQGLFEPKSASGNLPHEETPDEMAARRARQRATEEAGNVPV